MKKVHLSLVCLAVLILFSGCWKEESKSQQVESVPKTSQSSRPSQSKASTSKSSTTPSSSNQTESSQTVEKLQEDQVDSSTELSEEASLNSAVETVPESSMEETVVSDGAVAEQNTTPAPQGGEVASLSAQEDGTPSALNQLISGDYSAIAGTWSDNLGNSVVVDAGGEVQMVYADGRILTYHIIEGTGALQGIHVYQASLGDPSGTASVPDLRYTASQSGQDSLYLVPRGTEVGFNTLYRT